MKITDIILSIPPYISTAWKNVVSLRVQGSTLLVELASGSKVEIPNLDAPTLKLIFAAHASSCESKKLAIPLIPGIEALGNLWQHSPEQASSPDLPPEMIEKIEMVAKNMPPAEANLLPKAEPHCNCPYCQIVRVIHTCHTPIEEEVTDADLQFRDWDIQQEADKLYVVMNPFDKKEHYHVFLGEPLGCTCGQKNCEHLQAVLKS
jgi:hypothetical protein